MFNLALNKFLSLGLFFLIVLSTYLITQDPTTHSKSLLYITMFLGYGHFIISAIYQIQYPLKSKNYRYINFFVLFAFLSIVLTLFAIYYNHIALLAILAIFIFIIHGTLNEQLHISRLTGIQTPTFYWVGLSGYICLLTLYSLPHPSFFFTPQIEFMELDFLQASALFENIIPLSLFYVIQFLMLYVCMRYLILPLWQRDMLHGFLISGLCLITWISVWLVSPIHYVYLFTLLLSYHFITWMIFGLQNLVLKDQASAIRNYVVINVIIYGALISILLFSFLENSVFATFIFDIRTFLVFTYLHIITSFLNEPWLKKIISL